MVKNPRTVMIDPSKNSKAASHQHQQLYLSMDERGLATRNSKSSNFTGDLRRSCHRGRFKFLKLTRTKNRGSKSLKMLGTSRRLH
ncbi:hypothetical protein V1478_008680 [Vespula squamosa]|uniref:Uncharacterized protein n=1 Tax=Vespula squamosa TaxID=30214 RepID=A0ABD2AU85_VESSQ